MSDWTPSDHTENDTVNALLNIAESIAKLAEAVDGLLYGLKFGRENGMSIAEAIEVGAREIAGAASVIADALEEP